MANLGPNNVDEILTVLQSNWVGNCCAAAASALVFYDHARTSGREFDLIWGRKHSSVTILFHVNRWVTFAWAILNVAGFWPFPTISSCIGFNVAGYVCDIILFTTWSAFSVIRIFAISKGNWWLTTIVGLLNMAPIGANSYAWFAVAFYEIDGSLPAGPQCVAGANISNSANIILAVSVRACVILADCIILFATWVRTYRIAKNVAHSENDAPLAILLLRDGTIYFLILLCLNIIDIVGNTVNFFAYAAAFISPISSIIVSHFLLNLRQVGRVHTNDTFGSIVELSDGGLSQITSIRFASFVDNMGEMLDHGA